MPSNLARKAAQRKQQTRLTFDPISSDLRSSSPATNLSPANVRYQLPNQRNTPSSSRYTYNGNDEDESEDPLSAGKGRSLVNSKGKGRAREGKLPFKALPTPVKSSQPMTRGTSAFAKNISIGELSEDEMESKRIRAERRTSKGFTHATSSSKRHPRPEVDLDESDGSLPEDEAETPSKRSWAKQKVIPYKGSYESDLSDEEMQDSPVLPPRFSQIGRHSASLKSASKRNSQRQKSLTLSGGSKGNSPSPASQILKQDKACEAKKQIQVSEADDDTDDILIASSSRRKHRSNAIELDESDIDLPAVRKSMHCSSSPANGKSKGQAISIEDSEDEDIVITSVDKRRSRHYIQENEESEGESHQDPISSPLKKKRRRLIVIDSGDSDVRSSPRKRRRQHTNNAEEGQDEDSDLPSVSAIRSNRKTQPSSSNSASTNRLTRQSKSRKHRTEREKNMELLRRKRAGEDIDQLSDSSEDSSEPKRGIYDSDSNLEILDDFEDDSEPEIVQSSKKKSDPNINSYDSDFVVDDDENGLLGVPVGLLDIPLQFRHAAHKPMKEHFKEAIEWMVHRKINPAFSRNDEIYLQAFRKLDDEYMGYAKSKFVSTQWTAEFTRAIYARPILIDRDCGGGEGYTLDGVPKCDVCNHRKHVPKFALHFEGKAYHKSNLEEVERQESENSDSESDDGVSLNSNGHSLPAEDKEWFSGRVCRDNAQQAHALIHWKYALNEWVVDQLENEGYLIPERLAEREKMKAKKRRDYANGLVDGWEEAGIIKNLYRDFKSQLEAARESKQGRWEKGKFTGFGGGDN